MFKHIVVQSFRRILNDKTNSFLKIVGLSIGLSVALVITVFSVHELSYDNFHKDTSQIYRILNHQNSEMTWTTTPFILGNTIMDQIPEVVSNAKLCSLGTMNFKKENEMISETKVLATNSDFFEIFTFPVLHGDLKKFDNNSNGIILSKSMAHKYFGEYFPLDNIIEVELAGKTIELTVCAIMEDFPINSSIKADFIVNPYFGYRALVQKSISTSQTPITKDQMYNKSVFHTNYIKVSENTNKEELQKKINNLTQSIKFADFGYNFQLQAFSDMYFHSTEYVDNLNIEKGNLSLIVVLIIIGILILAIATINYINLTVAQIHIKNHFIAIRKICGALRKNLITQITFDSLIFTLITAPIALLLTFILLPVATNILGKDYQLSVFDSYVALAIIIGIIILVGLTSGFLIGLKTTSYNAIKTLKNQMTSASKFGLKKVLVIFQMVVSVCLITMVLFIQKQTKFSINKDLGFNTEHLLIINFNDLSIAPDYITFKEAIRNNSDIIEVSGSMWTPPNMNRMLLNLPKVNEPENTVSISGLFTDFNFEKTMGLKLIKGEFPNKEKGIFGLVVNESAVKELGLTRAVGEQTSFGQVVGVVKDFHISSTHNVIPPVMIVKNEGMVREMIVKTSGNHVLETIAYLKKKWKELGGKEDCELIFFDHKVQELYITDLKLSQLIMGSAILAILIAILGLAGLALFMIKQKTKEVGIRKVNGAKISEILILLNKDFVWWTVLSVFIATPIIYLIVSKWLEGFAYKTDISWWVFIIGGFVTLVTTVLTISMQTYMAARRNPIEALRYE
ncbi:MAG: ABC transporter permease [Salinivirgaceae bacterium]|nr:ABC transporter permease [Salinivirgaceae bacterium]